MELSERKRKILCMAVEEYIRDCSPITSGGIKDIGSLNCSTATLRNELNALEAMGYLRQLHTSGGRVPTPQGYRYYVEQQLSSIEATNQELNEVKSIIRSRTSSLNDIVEGIAKIVSDATNYPTVIMVDGYENLVLTEFKIFPLLEDKLMVLIGTSTGYIHQTLDQKASNEECVDATNYLTNHFRGETIGYMIENIKQLRGGMLGEIKAFSRVVNSMIDGLQKLNKRYLNVRREGSSKLLEDKSDVEDAKKVLNVLDDENKLSSIMELEGKGEIEVTIAESNDTCSVVKAPIKVNGRQLASIGVIGPQRMDYGAIAAALKVVVDSLNSLKGE